MQPHKVAKKVWRKNQFQKQSELNTNLKLTVV